MQTKTIHPRRLIVGLSGASGAQIAIELLQAMRQFRDWETHLVISHGARRTIELETDFSVGEVESLATKCHALDDVGASIASGTFEAAGMVIVPCSMKTLAGIAHGFSQNLLLRAADVTLKERRKLVLLVRESPLSSIHLNNMVIASNAGAIILPPVLTFYTHPTTIQDLTNHIVCKALDIFGLAAVKFNRWDETHDLPFDPDAGKDEA